MKTLKLIICIFYIVLVSPLTSQSCLPGGIIFNNQAEVDAFAINYPGCTEIMGNVYIQGNITNVNALSNIVKINGLLNIVNTTLNQPNIFPNLQHVTRSLLIANTGVTELSGFNNLTKVNYKIEIYNNDNLATLDGFNALTTTDTITVGQQVDIRNSFSQIQTLKLLKVISYLTTGPGLQVSGANAFSSLNKTDLIEITGLQNSNLNFLSNLDTVSSYFYINNLPNLTTLSGLSSLASVKTLLIGGNNALANLNLPPTLKISSLNVVGNPILTNLQGLPSISQLDELVISANASLVSLDGINNLNTVKNTFYLTSNDVLTNISALDNIKIVGSNVYIYDNVILNACCKIASLVTKNRILGEVQIYNNGPECSSLLDIIGTYCYDGDEDEVIDLVDNCPFDYNDDQEDIDNDGIGDACDNCPLISNADQADANNDGVGNVCQSVSGIGALEISSDVYVDNSLRGVVLKSPNGFCYRVKVNNKGKLSVKKINCP